MSKILNAARKEVPLLAGLLSGVLSFALTNQNVLVAMIPVVLSLVARSQVAPVAKLEELLALIGQLKRPAKPADPPAAPAKP